MLLKKHKACNILFSFIYVSLCMLYYYYLVVGCDLYTCGSVYLPDSEIYMHLYNDSDIRWASWNVYGVTIFYGFISGIIDPLYLNLILVVISNGILIGMIFERLPRNKIIVYLVLYCNPAIVYYSQTPTKEIILYFFTTLILYFFVKRKKVFYLPVIIFGGVIRYQFFVVTMSSYIGVIFRKNAFLLVRLSILLLFLLLPLIYNTPLLQGYINAEEIYLTQSSGSSGIGQSLRMLERSIPLVGFITFPIKSLQNILEPFMGLSLYQGDYFNFYGVKDAISFLFFGWYYIYGLVSLLFILLMEDKREYRNADDIFVIFIVLTSFIIVSVNTFIHGRYIFNILPVVVYFYYSGVCVPKVFFVKKIVSVIFLFSSLIYFYRFFTLFN